jgi:Fe-S-cluster containining protein
MSDDAAAGKLEGICGTCGMCCDGVLFHAVELQPGDHPRQLSALGLKLRRKKGVEFFLQPCSAHRADGGQCSCAIYQERPMRCRAFDCRQLRGVLAGEISGEDAMAKIREAREKVAMVNCLIDQIGETNPNRGLAHRVANALTLPPGDECDTRHEKLEASMKELDQLLQRFFRTQ